MNDDSMSRIAHLASSGSLPQAEVLNPEVRSGASFTFGTPPAGLATWPNFKLVWFYTVPANNRMDFADKVRIFESSATPLGSVTYLSTYSVSISAAAPDYEYRTFWGLSSLSAIEDLNNLLHAPTPLLKDLLDLISPLPAMRAEIMGRTVQSAQLTGT